MTVSGGNMSDLRVLVKENIGVNVTEVRRLY